MKYYVFGYDARPHGGLNDLIATEADLEVAKSILQKEAPNHAYWHEYRGQIAIFEDDKFKVVLHYAAELEGNIWGGRIKCDAFSEDGKETAELLSRIP